LTTFPGQGIYVLMAESRIRQIVHDKAVKAGIRRTYRCIWRVYL